MGEYDKWTFNPDAYTAGSVKKTEKTTKKQKPKKDKFDEILEVNKSHLKNFEKWLNGKGLSKKTIVAHLENVDFYINEFLCYYEVRDVVHGCYAVDSFLGEWFPRKAMWASKASIKSNAASFKKFYAFLLENGVVKKKDYDELVSAIKSNMPDWLEQMERYDEEWELCEEEDEFGLMTSLDGYTSYDYEMLEMFKAIIVSGKVEINAKILEMVVHMTAVLGMREGAPDELKLSSRVIEIMEPWIDKFPFEELAVNAIQAWNESLGMSGDLYNKNIETNESFVSSISKPETQKMIAEMKARKAKLFPEDPRIVIGAEVTVSEDGGCNLKTASELKKENVDYVVKNFNFKNKL